MQEHVNISHDVHIGANTVLSAKVTFGGCVQVGANCFFGIASSMRENITIGANAVIGMGAVVLHDVVDGSVIVGNPARYLRKNETGEVFHN